jgi:hypothetical protein
MPVFGEYESDSEPFEVNEESGYVTRVYRARKSGRGPAVAIKSFRAIWAARGSVDVQELAPDFELHFHEAITLLQRAYAGPQGGIAPVHAHGRSVEAGTWYATDYCERGSLKRLVERRFNPDDAALRNIVGQVVAGCLAMRQVIGRSHGNLKLANILVGGAAAPLRRAPLYLTDPYPASPSQIAGLSGGDRSEVGSLLADVAETQDLHGLGEVILQLVEGRVYSRRSDYNYPIAPSDRWARLGKTADDWRALCNQLLDPHRKPGQITLDQLAQRFPPKQLTHRTTQLALRVAAGFVVLLGVGWGLIAFNSPDGGGTSDEGPNITQPKSGDAGGGSVATVPSKLDSVPDPHAIQLAQLTAWVEQHDYLRALSPTNQWPTNTHFNDLLTRADQGRAARYNDTIHQAREALASQDFQRARLLAQEAILWDSPHAPSLGHEAKTLLTQIENERQAWQARQHQLRIDEENREKQIETWTAALDREDYQAVLSNLPRLPAAWRADIRIEKLISRAEKMEQDARDRDALAERNGRLEEWKRWLHQGDYQLLLDEADEVNARWPEDAEFLALLDQAELLRSAALKRAAELATRKQDYAQATQAFLDGRYEQALANLGEHRTENEKDALEFDVLRADITTEHDLLRQVQQPDTDPFEFLARTDLPAKEPFQQAINEAHDRALAQLDRWLDEEDYEAILDGLKDQPYAGQEEFAQRMRLPQVWANLDQYRIADKREDARQELANLNEEDRKRKPFQEFAAWANDEVPVAVAGVAAGSEDPAEVPITVVPRDVPLEPSVPAPSEEDIAQINKFLESYEVIFGVRGAPQSKEIDGRKYNRASMPPPAYLERASEDLRALQGKPLLPEQRNRLQQILDRIEAHRRAGGSRA